MIIRNLGILPRQYTQLQLKKTKMVVRLGQLKMILIKWSSIAQFSQIVI